MVEVWSLEDRENKRQSLGCQGNETSSSFFLAPMGEV